MSTAGEKLLQDYAVSKRRFSVQLNVLKDLRALAGQSADALPALSTALQERVKPIEDGVSESIARLCTEIETAERLIGQVENPVLKEVLERRYMQQAEFKEIAKEMHYSERHVRRLHRAALDQLPELPVP